MNLQMRLRSVVALIVMVFLVVVAIAPPAVAFQQSALDTLKSTNKCLKGFANK